ncbi:carbohydrate ABC transporter permease [Pontibacillus litoralis]|uniref:ABC transporter permease n=1 Tax=Pontibacillus litoralis JSM 072002 TaxID=1385512 RepID=A0A0A5G1Q0_9BACI|nr:carbohydrate ABC transporter permease [Pontibacillus litoralis]KGX87001.1 ABC transporter permease [Pontibacillus litoralis JSM 072002]
MDQATKHSIPRYIVLIVLSMMMIFPLIWMLLSSLKTGEEIFAIPLKWLPDTPQWGNFPGALELAPFGLYIYNSTVTALVIVVFQVVLACMMAYALTQLQFKGKNVLFNSILMTYMLPVAATYVPSYVIVAKLGLLDTLAGIIISNIASVFCIFMIRQAFMQVPKEMVEAARADGANDVAILWKVMIPMSKSSIFTVALISFVQMYNNYLWPSLIVKSQENYLVTVGLNQFFTAQGTFSSQWPMIMAANVLAVLPLLLLFIVLQKWFIKGISDNGLKG